MSAEAVTDRDDPVALAYDEAADGELIAELYTIEVAAECEDSWWIRVEYLEDTSDNDGGRDS